MLRLCINQKGAKVQNINEKEMNNSLEFAQYKAQRIKELVPDYNQPGIKILDFGCGDGTMTNYLQEVFFEATIIGVDISKDALEQARQNYQHIQFKHLEQNALGFPDNHFNLIIAAEIFHHINRTQHKKYLDEILRVLKKTGTFIMLERNSYNVGAFFRFKRDPQEYGNRLLSPWYTSTLLKKYGKPHFYYYCFFPTWLWFLVFLEPWLIKVPLGQLYGVVIKKN